MNIVAATSYEETLNNLTPFAVMFFLIGIVAFIIGIAYIIRLWLTQTATFQIQKDVADIRDHILGHDVESESVERSQTVINGYVEPPVSKKKIVIKRPRKLFIWISITIPMLLIVLVVIINLHQ